MRRRLSEEYGMLFILCGEGITSSAYSSMSLPRIGNKRPLFSLLLKKYQEDFKRRLSELFSYAPSKGAQENNSLSLLRIGKEPFAHLVFRFPSAHRQKTTIGAFSANIKYTIIDYLKKKFVLSGIYTSKKAEKVFILCAFKRPLEQ